MPYDTLNIKGIHRIGAADKTEKFTYDFLVNGKSLYELLKVSKFDMVGRFGDGDNDWNKRSADVFTLKAPSDLENGRSMLYVCPECADIGCGAITLKISESADSIEWSNFGYENGYDSDMTDTNSFEHIGPFKFEKSNYQAIIFRAMTAIKKEIDGGTAP